MFKVGDKVLYNGEKRTVAFTPENNSEEKWLHDDFVILDHDLFFAISVDDLEPYKTAHEELLELGFIVENESDNLRWYIPPKEFEEHYDEITFTVDFKNKKVSYDFMYEGGAYFGLELSKIFVKYLEELNEV